MTAAAEPDFDVVEELPPNPAIVFRDIDSLVPYARNARKHSDQQVVGIASMIAGFGWTNPVLIDEEQGIVAGHGRVLAAQLLYDEGKTLANADGTPIPPRMVPTIACRGWSDAQKRAYIIADNQWTIAAEWDIDLLGVELDELRDMGVDALTLGFSSEDLNDLIGTPNFGPSSSDAQSRLDQREPIECPQCGHKWLRT